METVAQKGSYLIGHNIGSQLSSEGIEVDLDALAAGIAAALAGKEPAVPKEQIRQVMQEFQREAQAKASEKKKAEGTKNAQEGKDFLAQNAKKKGVQTTPSGLQYEVIQDGKGAKPKETDTVQTHYKGTLLSGKVFDSSYDRGEPAEFPVNGVIKGWQEALQLMNVGSKWKLYVPSDLAYGERGAGADIGPNSVLVFEVELLGISE